MAKTKLGAMLLNKGRQDDDSIDSMLRKVNDKQQDDDSIDSMLRKVNDKDDKSKGWSKLRNLLQKDDKIEAGPIETERKSSLGSLLLSAAKKSQDAENKNSNDDADDLSSNLDPNLVPSDSIQKLDNGENSSKYNLNIISTVYRKKFDEIKEVLVRHKYVISVFFTIILICGVIGIVFSRFLNSISLGQNL